MEYIGTTLNDDIRIEKLYTVHYFEFSKDYTFTGESHDFWEMVYADRGGVICVTEKGERELKSGELIFHEPNEWHNLKANGIHAPNVAIISFSSTSKLMREFVGRVFKIGRTHRELISKILAESKKAFSSDFADPYMSHLEKIRHSPLGCQQLIRLYLTELLLLLLRQDERYVESPLTLDTDNRVIARAESYMKENVGRKLRVDDIAASVNLSPSCLKKLFSENAGMGVIEYFIKLKTEYAKALLRDENYNITQIAYLLGYDGIHYFSKQFKTVTGMSPSEYYLSVKHILEKNKN